MKQVCFSASEPDLMVDDVLQCVDDTFFDDQWNLNNTGRNGGNFGVDIDICNAWEITMGCNDVIIAVLDQGIELNHPDLLNMSPLSFDTESGTSPSLVLGSHGTACAGIIGAYTDNNIGTAGVAPNCQLMSISNSLDATPNSRQRRGDGINWAWQNGADVISNSWGSGVQYQIIDDAIDNALTLGRGGLGCVVVFATGNDNSSVNYPANSNPDIIAVGAMSMCGERKSPNSCDGENWGSNYGSHLDIVAPGVLIPTTDRQGNNGYNPDIPIHINNGGTLVSSDYDNTDFTIWFNGTSSAAPHVAGVAALILSINPDLTQDEVRNIIESSGNKIGGYNYSIKPDRYNGTWNNEMGYGLVNALDAVSEALNNTTIVGPAILCTSNQTFYLHNRPAGTSVNWIISDNFIYVSGQGTNYLTVRAINNEVSLEDVVSANIQFGSCDYTVSKTAWLGRPMYSGYEPLYIHPELVCQPVYDDIFATVGYPVFRVPGATGYAWDIFPGSQYFTIYEPNPVIPTAFITVLPNAPSGQYTLLVGSLNECGGGTAFNEGFEIGIPDYWGNCESAGGGGGWLFGMSPNPADNTLEITAEPDPLAKAEDMSETYEVKIYNTLKMPVYQSIITSEPTLKINLTNFKEGIYFVYFITGKDIVVKQLIISR